MDVVGQRYALERRIGEGGTAVVWVATDRVLGRPCAVKLLVDTGEGAGGELRRRRLRQEAQALATLDHPHVVRVYDLGEHEGRPFLAMEYVPGGSLAERLVAEGPLAPEQAVERVLEVLEALDAAHTAGIVHRDVKPHNVLVRDDGTCALCDFGIARQEDRSHTRTGVALGSVDYMAPEQRIDARRAGPAADVYGVGTTLYHLLTAETPVDLYLASEHSPRWEGVPSPLRPIVRRATAADPSERFTSAAEMGQELRQVLPALRGIPPRTFTWRGTPAPSATRDEAPRGDHRLGVSPTREAGGVGAEEWGWSKKGRWVGRNSVAIGLAAVCALLVLSMGVWPWLEARIHARRHAPVLEEAVAATAPVDLRGRWQGNLGGERHPVTAVFHGEPSALEGTMVVDLDGNELRASLKGTSTDAAFHLVTSNGSLLGTVDEFGVLRGQLRLGEGPARTVALVRIGD